MSLQKELKLFPDSIAVGVGSVLAASKALVGVTSGGLSVLLQVCLIRDTWVRISPN